MGHRVQFLHGLLGLQQGLGCHQTEHHDQFGLYDLYLFQQVRQAGLPFGVFGVAVAGRAAFDDVADIDVLPLYLDGGQHLGEQIPCPAHEGPSAQVFLFSRPLSDEHRDGIGIALSIDKLDPALMERAQGAGGVLELEFGQQCSFVLRLAVDLPDAGVLQHFQVLLQGAKGHSRLFFIVWVVIQVKAFIVVAVVIRILVQIVVFKRFDESFRVVDCFFAHFAFPLFILEG